MIAWLDTNKHAVMQITSTQNGRHDAARSRAFLIGLGSERPMDQPFGVRSRERMRGHCGVHSRERGRGRRGNVILEERLMAISRAGGTDPGAGRYELGATLRKPANNATS
jgi:hypothetical protein